MASPPTNRSERPKSRLSIDRVRLVYGLLVAAQLITVALYEVNGLAKSVALLAGLSTSIVGPFLSFLISLHVFRHRRRSKLLDIASIGFSYVFTCSSFAIIDLVIGRENASAFNQTGAPNGALSLGSSMYFSVVTITTTGYGDISPHSGLARLTACVEIGTGLLYQVVVFSLLASLLLPGREDLDQAKDSGRGTNL